MAWHLWARGTVERQVEGVSPLLASWEKSTHPSQVRLRSYLETVIAQLKPLPEDVPLFLHMDIDVGDPKRLLRHHDLENYLTPLFGLRWLPASRFRLVSARKFVGGGSRIMCGIAVPSETTDESGWSHLTFRAGRNATHRDWKERIRQGLVSVCASPISPGPAHVRLAWQCSSKRNWSMLWKSTGDAMGPVLGCSNAARPYHLDDDRIQDLALHHQIDDSLGHDVVVGIWCKHGKENLAAGSTHR